MKKLEALKEKLKNMDRAALAFSGSLSSIILLKIGEAIMGNKLIVLTVDSPFFPSYALMETKNIVKGLKCVHKIIQLEKDVTQKIEPNTTFRYYYYMDEIIRAVKKHTNDPILLGARYVSDPDHDALNKLVKEYSIMTPLSSKTITMDDLREMAKIIGIDITHLHSMSWLGNRIPYGIPITLDLLKRIDEFENHLLGMGIHHSKVMVGDDHTAIITVSHADMQELVWHSKSIDKKGKVLGFEKVSVQVPEILL